MRLPALAFKLHRWLAYLVGIQVLIWVVGGLSFALLPFRDWVKSGECVRKPVAEYPAAALARIADHVAGAEQLKVYAGPAGPSVLVKGMGTGAGLAFDARGERLAPPQPDQIAALARTLHICPGELTRVEKVDAGKRLGIVDETGGRGPLWRASFDDRLGTRLYFAPESGEFLHASNDVWVLYDLLWRLHIMDYAGGEDFNNPLLRGFAIAALCLTLSGSLLAVLALRRAMRRRRV